VTAYINRSVIVRWKIGASITPLGPVKEQIALVASIDFHVGMKSSLYHAFAAAISGENNEDNFIVGCRE